MVTVGKYTVRPMDPMGFDFSYETFTETFRSPILGIPGIHGFAQTPEVQKPLLAGFSCFQEL